MTLVARSPAPGLSLVCMEPRLSHLHAFPYINMRRSTAGSHRRYRTLIDFQTFSRHLFLPLQLFCTLRWEQGIVSSHSNPHVGACFYFTKIRHLSGENNVYLISYLLLSTMYIKRKSSLSSWITRDSATHSPRVGSGPSSCIIEPPSNTHAFLIIQQT